jgi:hypothetical protein
MLEIIAYDGDAAILGSIEQLARMGVVNFALTRVPYLIGHSSMRWSFLALASVLIISV